MVLKEVIATALGAIIIGLSGSCLIYCDPSPNLNYNLAAMRLIEKGDDVRVYHDEKRGITCFEFARGVWCEHDREEKK